MMMEEMWISLEINTREESRDIWLGICNQCIVSLLIRYNSYNSYVLYTHYARGMSVSMLFVCGMFFVVV